VLDHVAGDRKQRNQKNWDRDGRDDLGSDTAGQTDERGAIRRNLMGVRNQTGEGPFQARTHRTGKGCQHQRSAGQHEPGRNLLAFCDIPALKRVFQPLLCWVF
jgi:hypothetical protein